jgi:hypothetical protein
MAETILGPAGLTSRATENRKGAALSAAPLFEN